MYHGCLGGVDRRESQRQLCQLRDVWVLQKPSLEAGVTGFSCRQDCRGSWEKRSSGRETSETSATKKQTGGAWVAQSVKHLTLVFGSGYDLTVHGIEPRVGLCADRAEPTWNSLSASLCPFSARMCALSK